MDKDQSEIPNDRLPGHVNCTHCGEPINETGSGSPLDGSPVHIRCYHAIVAKNNPQSQIPNPQSPMEIVRVPYANDRHLHESDLHRVLSDKCRILVEEAKQAGIPIMMMIESKSLGGVFVDGLGDGPSCAHMISQALKHAAKGLPPKDGPELCRVIASYASQLRSNLRGKR
jgi:hypothetical protein